MGPKHDQDMILAAAVDLAFAEGLSRVSFGRVAKRLGISDRTVVYYFPTKDVLVGAVLLAVGLRLQETLEQALVEPAADHRALARAAWPVLAHPDADGVFALFFEANGLATAGHEPYATVVPQLVEAWLAWAAEHLQGDPGQRRAEATAAVALIDGLLLLRQLAGPEAARTAAERTGVSPGRPPAVTGAARPGSSPQHAPLAHPVGWEPDQNRRP